jgi:hypothetical protein
MLNLKDLETKRISLQKELSDKLPKEFQNWNQIWNRIESIHENYSETLSEELEYLEKIYPTSILDTQNLIEELEYMESQFECEKEIAFLYLEGVVGIDTIKTITVHSWEQYLEFLKDVSGITKWQLRFKDSSEAGATGMNCSYHLSNVMQSCGVYEEFWT